MTPEAWPSQWLRGTLKLCVLAVLAQEPSYGYAVGQRLKAAGMGSINGGTLYPILARMEHDELVTSWWREGSSGPGRKYFAITRGGLDHLAMESHEWRAFSATVAELLAAHDQEEIPA